ncbi:MAG TPA: acyl-CoA dehydrogenase family protein [Chloroflexota bacterium]|nr:acyl-CoA dehydrogenase family protein [Chloroflexota bacterium]
MSAAESTHGAMALLVDLPTEESIDGFRVRIRQFISEHLPADWDGIGQLQLDEAAEFTRKWRDKLAAHGLLAVAWPHEYGGSGLSKLHQVVVAEECARAGVPAGVHGDLFGIKMLGNTLLRLGTEEQKRRLLPRILSGEDRWCQGFSEPDAGSDLASLRTVAHLEGNEWVITGQKIWTSLATEANWIFLLARTDSGSSLNRGLSFLLCPLDQTGIEIRQIKMLSGRSEFCEVFFDAARTPAENTVGRPGEGWSVAMSLFGHERGEEAGVHPILFRHELDRLLELARDRGCSDDPVVRNLLADCFIRVEVMRFLGYRIIANVMSDAALGPESSIAKLYWSEYHQRVTALALRILGADAMTPEGRPPARPTRADDPYSPNSSASWVGAFYNATAGTIYAGTSEIQRNILAESVLRLPKDPMHRR